MIFAVGKSWKCGADFSSLLRLYCQLLERVCRPCGLKIRNAAQLYSFIEKAVSSTIFEEDLHWEAVEDRRKRQLPKKRCKKETSRIWRWTGGKVNSRKALFAESSKVGDSSDIESGSASIETFYTQTPEQVTLTLAGQDADILLNYCSIEDITGNPSTQFKAPALILNPDGEVIVRKMFDNTTQAEIASLACWTSLFYFLINQSEFASASVRRGEQSGVITAL